MINEQAINLIRNNKKDYEELLATNTNKGAENGIKNIIKSYSVVMQALEKQIPIEVDTETINRGIGVSGEYDIDSNMLCPNCHSVVGDYDANELYYGYCPSCGQKLKYTETQE